MKKGIPEIREREGNEKNVPKIRERESEAIIPGNGREREWNEKITMIRTDWKCCEMFGK